MSLEYRAGQILGLGKRTEAEMETMVSTGQLPASALVKLVRSIADSQAGPSTTAIAKRIVSRATWNRALRNPSTTLSISVGDKVERVASLLSHAVNVWGDASAAREFITSEQTLLGGAPLDLTADSTVGARRVEALLTRIDHGIAV